MCSLPYSLGFGNPWNHQELCRPHVGGRKESETPRRMRQDRNVEGNGETWERTGNSEDQGKIVQNRTMWGWEGEKEETGSGGKDKVL